jgi:voltage-gated sodium channel
MSETQTITLPIRVGNWIESPPIRNFIIVLIAINAITLGMETSPKIMAQYSGLLHIADRTILSIFVVEIALKMYAYRSRFFTNGWNVFDFIVVGIALLPSIEIFSVFRILRVLRVLRLISMIPQLRLVVDALLQAIPGISSIFALLIVLYYIFAVIATKIFGPNFPQWFGDIGSSMYTLFQIMTLESWSMGIVRPVMEAYPYAWLFFIPFILVATFTMLNLFIAIIVNSMQTLHDQEQQRINEKIEEIAQSETELLEAEIRQLRIEIQELKTLLTHKASS